MEKQYQGMQIGQNHQWHYNGQWNETKTSQNKWKINFKATKTTTQYKDAGNTQNVKGVPLNTEYHWLIIADQKVIKTANGQYQTEMTGNKYKIGHKRPYWKTFSYNYKEQKSETQQKLTYLTQELKQIGGQKK